MSVRERFIPDDGNTGATMLLIDELEFKSSRAKTHGMWLLFVSESACDAVIGGLRLMVEDKRNQFTAVMTDMSVMELNDSKVLVCVSDEGALYRRRLGKCLRAFDQIGVDGSWMFCDGGADRHKTARRFLLGKRPLDLVTEMDYRRGGIEPIIRKFSVPKR